MCDQQKSDGVGPPGTVNVVVTVSVVVVKVEVIDVVAVTLVVDVVAVTLVEVEDVVVTVEVVVGVEVVAVVDETVNVAVAVKLEVLLTVTVAVELDVAVAAKILAVGRVEAFVAKLMVCETACRWWGAKCISFENVFGFGAFSEGTLPTHASKACGNVEAIGEGTG